MKGLLNAFAIGAMALTSYTSYANTFITINEQDHKVFAKQNGTTETVSIIETYGTNWKKFSSFLGKKDQWVWTSKDNEKVYWFDEYGQSSLLVDFRDPEGTVYNVEIDACATEATLASKEVSISTIAGQFVHSAELTFKGNCADAGLTSAVFAPTVGLVKYSEQSIMGPVTTELVSGSLAGTEYPIFNGIEMSAQFPAGRVMVNQQDAVSAYLVLSNKTNQTQSFTFNSSKLFDIEIVNNSGEVVNRWSANKRFLMAIQHVELEAGETRRFGGEVKLVDFEGNALEIGTYTLRISLDGTNKPDASAFTRADYAAEAPLYIDQMISL